MKRSSLSFFGLLILGLASLTACAPSLATFPFGTGTGTHIRPDSPNLQIRYHSVGCFYLEANGVGVLTDPFFTHVSAAKVGFGRVEPDPKEIEAHKPPLDKIKAVTIAHGHYDHVMALPYLSPMLPEGTLVLGSRSVACQMSACQLEQPIIPVDEKVADENQPGEWIYVSDSSIRILPLLTTHGPHLLGLKLYHGHYSQDAELPPCKATDFQEGQTLAYLYDFMEPDGKGIAYRVFFMSSSTGFPDGYFPQSILDEKSVDVALLTVDCTENKLKGKKGIIDYLNPPTVIINHWENFFRPKKWPPKALRVNLWTIEEELNGKNGQTYIVPMWDRVYEIEKE